MSEQSMIDAAKAPILAYGRKDWDAARAALTPGVQYDEIATHRMIEGAEQVISCWKGWAAALPDSKATFHNAMVSGDSVVLELTWRGTHTGTLETPSGKIAPTGKPVEIRSCQIVEVAGGRVRALRQYFDLATLLSQIGAAK